MARWAALGMLMLALVALSVWAVRSAVQLDERFHDERYVVHRVGSDWCPLVQWRANAYEVVCPIGHGQGET